MNDGWNDDGISLVAFNVPGKFAGKINGCSFRGKDDGTGQLVFQVLPMKVVAAGLPDGLTEADLPGTGNQRFSMYVAGSDPRTLRRVATLCAALGVEKAQQALKGRLYNWQAAVTAWASELDETRPDCQFTMAQARYRKGYHVAGDAEGGALDDEGEPIYEVSRIYV